jgi:hypothetical protein
VDDLIAKLKAALDAEEQIANGVSDGPWSAVNVVVYDADDATVADRAGWGEMLPEDVQHIACQNPKRTLEKIAAVRELIARYEAASAFYNARKEAPAGEVYGLYTAIKLIAKGYGIDE